MSRPNTGAPSEIAIDGTVWSHRDREDMAIEAARHLKIKQPRGEGMVRDLEAAG
jgi:hypothetical protein